MSLRAVDLHILTDPRYRHNLRVDTFFASHLPPFLILFLHFLCSASHLAFFLNSKYFILSLSLSLSTVHHLAQNPISPPLIPCSHLNFQLLHN